MIWVRIKDCQGSIVFQNGYPDVSVTLYGINAALLALGNHLRDKRTAKLTVEITGSGELEGAK